MDTAQIAIYGLVIEGMLLIIGAVWVVAKVKTESALNRQSIDNLTNTLSHMDRTLQRIDRDASDLIQRVAVLEAKDR